MLEGYTASWDALGVFDSIRGVLNGTTIITQGQSVVCEGAIREVVDSSNLTYQTLANNFTLYGSILATKALFTTVAQTYDLANSCYLGIFEAWAVV